MGVMKKLKKSHSVFDFLILPVIRFSANGRCYWIFHQLKMTVDVRKFKFYPY